MKDIQTKTELILIVDDEPRVLRFIEIGLRNRGFGVGAASSGEAATGLIEESEPDVVPLDIVMPKLDGLEMLRRLRARRQMPVIAFSANLDTRHKAMSLRLPVWFPSHSIPIK